MTEFRVQIEDSFVQSYGYREVESQLYAFVKQLYLKIAAQDLA